MSSPIEGSGSQTAPTAAPEREITSEYEQFLRALAEELLAADGVTDPVQIEQLSNELIANANTAVNRADRGVPGAGEPVLPGDDGLSAVDPFQDSPNLWLLAPAFITIHTTLMFAVSQALREVMALEGGLKSLTLEGMVQSGLLSAERSREVAALTAAGHFAQAAASLATAAVSAGMLVKTAKIQTNVKNSPSSTQARQQIQAKKDQLGPTPGNKPNQPYSPAKTTREELHNLQGGYSKEGQPLTQTQTKSPEHKQAVEAKQAQVKSEEKGIADAEIDLARNEVSQVQSELLQSQALQQTTSATFTALQNFAQGAIEIIKGEAQAQQQIASLMQQFWQTLFGSASDGLRTAKESAGRVHNERSQVGQQARFNVNG